MNLDSTRGCVRKVVYKTKDDKQKRKLKEQVFSHCQSQDKKRSSQSSGMCPSYLPRLLDLYETFVLETKRSVNERSGRIISVETKKQVSLYLSRLKEW